MACNCEKIKSLPTCLNELIIGTISLVSQDVYVFFKTINNGYVHRVTGHADSDGLVTVDPSSVYFTTNYSYELWITAIGDGPNDKQNITYDTYTFYDCLSFDCFRIENDSLESVYYASLTAELE